MGARRVLRNVTFECSFERAVLLALVLFFM